VWGPAGLQRLGWPFHQKQNRPGRGIRGPSYQQQIKLFNGARNGPSHCIRSAFVLLMGGPVAGSTKKTSGDSCFFAGGPATGPTKRIQLLCDKRANSRPHQKNSCFQWEGHPNRCSPTEPRRRPPWRSFPPPPVLRENLLLRPLPLTPPPPYLEQSPPPAPCT